MSLFNGHVQVQGHVPGQHCSLSANWINPLASVHTVGPSGLTECLTAAIFCGMLVETTDPIKGPWESEHCHLIMNGVKYKVHVPQEPIQCM